MHSNKQYGDTRIVVVDWPVFHLPATWETAGLANRQSCSRTGPRFLRV